MTTDPAPPPSLTRMSSGSAGEPHTSHAFGAPLRVVGGLDLDPETFGPPSAVFRDVEPDDAMSAGINVPSQSGNVGAATVPVVTPQGNQPDLLRFSVVATSDAVTRINTEFFVLRSSGKIYRQGDDGDLSAFSKQEFKTALGGRWAEDTGRSGKVQRRPAADAWLESPQRHEFVGLQYCPNGIGLKQGRLNLFRGWGSVQPAGGDCTVIVDHISGVVAGANDAKAELNSLTRSESSAKKSSPPT